MSDVTAGSGAAGWEGTAIRQGAKAIGKRLAGRAVLAPLGPLGWALGAALTVYDAYELYQLYNKSHSETEDKEAEDCTGDCAQTKEERQRKRRKELEDEAHVGQSTKGKTKHGEKDGDFSDANGDFDSLEPDKVKEIDTVYGQGRTGQLADGTAVTVRPGSTDGRPTLELRNPANKRGTEIRYGHSGS